MEETNIEDLYEILISILNNNYLRLKYKYLSDREDINFEIINKIWVDSILKYIIRIHIDNTSHIIKHIDFEEEMKNYLKYVKRNYI